MVSKMRNLYKYYVYILQIKNYFTYVINLLPMDRDLYTELLEWKDSEGRSIRIPKEIDFIANRYEEKVYIQSAFAIPDDVKLHSEVDQFKHTGDSFRKIVVRNDVGNRWFDGNGVLHINVIDFMMDKELI